MDEINYFCKDQVGSQALGLASPPSLSLSPTSPFALPNPLRTHLTTSHPLPLPSPLSPHQVIPSELSVKLRSYFRNTMHQIRAKRYESLLQKMSTRLRGDVSLTGSNYLPCVLLLTAGGSTPLTQAAFRMCEYRLRSVPFLVSPDLEPEFMCNLAIKYNAIFAHSHPSKRSRTHTLTHAHTHTRTHSHTRARATHGTRTHRHGAVFTRIALTFCIAMGPSTI